MSPKQKEPYRLITYQSHSAAINMAIDEAILEAHLSSSVPPTLRLYQFAPPAVSFGYAQKLENDLIDQIKTKIKTKRLELEMVRRPTGGRAVLHMGDLTYAFVCSTKNAPQLDYALVGESIATAYKQICQALIFSLQSLGVEVSLGNYKSNYKNHHDCFLATTPADLQYQGKKIIGSAQLRRRHAVLQHGSIILNQSQSLLQELLNGSNGQVNRNENHHANLYEICGHKYSIADLVQTFKKGFETVFDNQFEAQDLTASEQDLVKELLDKYKSFV